MLQPDASQSALQQTLLLPDWFKIATSLFLLICTTFSAYLTIALRALKSSVKIDMLQLELRLIQQFQATAKSIGDNYVPAKMCVMSGDRNNNEHERLEMAVNGIDKRVHALEVGD